MEKPQTQEEARKEKYQRCAQLARLMAAEAMKEIDDALLESSELYKEWAGPQDGIPITDSDPLASPIGFYERPRSIYP